MPDTVYVPETWSTSLNACSHTLVVSTGELATQGSGTRTKGLGARNIGRSFRLQCFQNGISPFRELEEV